MRVSVVGTGYVGLVSGVCLAEKGHDVVCVDVDAAKVEKILRGVPPIFEDGLEALLTQNLGRGFSATQDLRKAILGSDLTLIAVGTPFDGTRIDLSFVGQVAGQIGEVLKDKSAYHVVVVKSTVVPSTPPTLIPGRSVPPIQNSKLPPPPRTETSGWLRRSVCTSTRVYASPREARR